MSESGRIILAIVMGIIVALSIGIYSQHVTNKNLCAPLEYEVKNNVLYCWYKGAWKKQTWLAKIGRNR